MPPDKRMISHGFVCRPLFYLTISKLFKSYSLFEERGMFFVIAGVTHRTNSATNLSSLALRHSATIVAIQHSTSWGIPRIYKA